MKIKDNNGIEQDIVIGAVKGTALVASISPLMIPVASEIITDDGLMMGVLRDNDFRGSEELTDFYMMARRDALSKGILPATSGYIYGFVNMENKISNKHWEKLGIQNDVVDVNGQKKIRWYVSVPDVLAHNMKR